MNIFKWFSFFKTKKEDNSTLEKAHSEYQKALNRNEFRIHRIPTYESPHDEVDRIGRRQLSDGSFASDILNASIANSLLDDSSLHSSSSYDSDNSSSGFSSGFGGGDYSGGGSSGDWGSSSDSSSYDSGSSDSYSSND